MKLIIFNVLFSLLLTWPLFGQISQTHPELCGQTDDSVALPPNISATVDKWEGQGDLFIGAGNSAVKISLPNVVDAIDEVCSISGKRLVVFGRAGGRLNNIAIVDSAKASLLDSFYGYSAVMSPNQRWLVYVKFYPLHSELPPSDEYLLYDLSKSPDQNRSSGDAPNDREDAGVVIFPVSAGNRPFNNMGLPPDQQHGMASASFYWAPDSGAIVFGDLLQQHFSIVLITLDNGGKATAFVHPVSSADVCGSAPPEDAPIDVESAEIGPELGGDRLIRMKFNNHVCAPKVLELHLSDFQPGKPEIHVPGKPKLKSIITR